MLGSRRPSQLKPSGMVPQLVIRASIESAIASRSMIVPSCLCVPMRVFYLAVTTRVNPSRWPAFACPCAGRSLP